MHRWIARAQPARRIVILLIAVVGVAMLAVSASADARLVWNFTPSVPTGLYSIEDSPWGRGDRVALKPSGVLLETLQKSGVLKEGRLLMKRVAAVAGDRVCRVGQQVSVNGLASAVARDDESLPAWSGCLWLEAEDVFLLGETDDSFDGRYFGVTSALDIVGPVRALFIF